MEAYGPLESYEFVEQLTKKWAELPKNQVVPVPTKTKSKSALGIYLELGGLWIVVALVVGVRGGISEEVFVIDPTKEVIADRLLVDRVEAGVDRGAVFFLPELRAKTGQQREGRKQRSLKVCGIALEGLLQKISKKPDTYETTFRHMESTSRSIRTVSGGLPSHGKRGGGISR